MNIQFTVLEKKSIENNDSFFDTIYITAHIGLQPVGFTRLQYISKETFNKKLYSVLAFFIYKINEGNNTLKEFFENKDYENLSKKLKSFGEHWVDIEKNIEQQYKSSYQKFINYWVNKPNQQLIYVLNENDNQFNQITDNFETIVDITPQNNRGQNISKKIMNFAILKLASKNLFLWESNKQTPSGKKLWINTNPYFNVANTNGRNFAFL